MRFSDRLNRKIRIAVFVCSAVLVTATCSGCGGADQQTNHSEEYAGPEFSGPYASELREAYMKAPEGFARDALSDGVVTDGERAEAIQRFGECLTGMGYGLAKYNENDGSFEIDLPSAADTDADRLRSQQAVQDCQTSSGLGALSQTYLKMRSNPENRDFAEVMVECLLRERVVPPGYGVADFGREYPLYEFTLLPKEARWGGKDPVMLCQNDPLNLMGTFDAYETG